MTRLYSSFDLDHILRDEDARRAQELKDAEAAARRAVIAEKRGGTPAVVPSAADWFSIEKSDSHFLLHNLVVDGKMGDYLWSGALLSGEHTQEEWLSIPEYRTVDGIKFGLPSSLEWGATIVALYHHRNTKDPAQQVLLEEFKLSLVDSLKRYVVTATRMTYTPTVHDLVEYLRRNSNHLYNADLAGKNCPLDASMSSETRAWFGVDAQEFMDAATWLTGFGVHVFRRERPKEKQEVRALVLGVVDSGRFNIDADDSINDDRPARGVAVRKILPPATEAPR